MRLEDLGLIGNCQFAALVESSGNVVWCCLPRFDSEPVFGSLLDGSGGQFSVNPPEKIAGKQCYAENSNILQTAFETSEGAFRVTDFAPRFQRNGQMFRPTQLVRIVEPLRGTPQVSVRCEPTLGWSKLTPARQQRPHGIEYRGYAAQLHLDTDIPVECLTGKPFPLTERKHLLLTWGEPCAGSLAQVCHELHAETLRYWQRWVKHCNIPTRYQREVIRSALALKLHCFEDTGAIVAAVTTSVPESAGSGRTWDYRYCWLRDAYYVMDALRLLGHFEEREHFIQYLLKVSANAPELDLNPLYRVDGGSDLEERIMDNWAGFNGDGPVRVGNAAARHRQHDVFGELVLAMSPIFLDERFSQERSPATLDLLERLTQKAISVAGTPCAGIWEVRKQWEPQTFSSLMCWAAANRMARIESALGTGRAEGYRQAAAGLHGQITTNGWSGEIDAFAGSYGGRQLDAALLQMAPLRFLPADDPRLVHTVDAIHAGLMRDGWLMRYRDDDGLGVPSVAFVICTFWLVEALVATGRSAEARGIMDRVHEVLSPLGLMAEDCDVAGRRLWGNFPQAYSHVGLIRAAFAASPHWSELL